MSEIPVSPDQSKDPDSTYLSFANPNYCFEDQLNSNSLKSPTEEDDSLSFDKLSVADGTANDKRIYANSDYSSAEMTPSSPDRSFILQKLNSQSDDTDDDTSSLDDDSEMTHNLLGSKEDVREETSYVPAPNEVTKKGRGILGYLAMLEQQAKDRITAVDTPDSPDDGLGAGTPDLDNTAVTSGEDSTPSGKFEDGTDINSPDSNDSGIQSDTRSDDGVSHVRAPATDDIYAVVQQKRKKDIISPDPEDSVYQDVVEEERTEERSNTQAEVLPPGWQKHEDEDGPYYWHIKSGTIQRDPPPPAPPDGPSLCTVATARSISIASDSSSQSASSIPSTPTSVTSNTERHLQEFEGHALQYAAKSLQSLVARPDQRTSLKEDEDNDGNQPVRFAVRSLGWVRIAEEDLTPERSSKAVNKCIVDLSLGRNDINDAVGRWGDGKYLNMDIDSHSLRLIDPSDEALLNSQPIHSIRVWGVGRDNGRDFAYVARDRATKVHMCHVFQCDTPARQIANTLRDICKRIMQERGLHVTPAEPRLTRPTHLPNLDKLDTSFPTPMEEPRKVIRCHYLGSHEVIRPTGMDVVNESVDWMYYRVPPEKWTFVSVAIAPSTITITEHGNPDNIIEECRVRFMSFMGISITSVKLCAFVMHTAQNKFVSHVFHCEPSAGPLCKTIEAACKLRYQKCLDAHPQTPKSVQNGKSVGAVFKAGVKASLQGVQSILDLMRNKVASGTADNKS